MKTFLENLKSRAAELKRDMRALAWCLRSGRLGCLPVFFIILALGYALSPIDLIPDFIPVLGQLDDLLIVPFLLGLAVRSIPPALMAEAREAVQGDTGRLPDNKAAAVIFIILWLVVLFWLGRLILGFLPR